MQAQSTAPAAQWECKGFHAMPIVVRCATLSVVHRYDITFPVFAKVDVNGPAAHPVFNFLKGVLGPGAAEAADWNFNKARRDCARAREDFNRNATPLLLLQMQQGRIPAVLKPANA